MGVPYVALCCRKTCCLAVADVQLYAIELAKELAPLACRDEHIAKGLSRRARDENEVIYERAQ
jgi:hypothetical protein